MRDTEPILESIYKGICAYISKRENIWIFAMRPRRPVESARFL